MFKIESIYNELFKDLKRLTTLALKTTENLDDEIMIGMANMEIEKALEKARNYDIERWKKSEGGKKASSKMTPEERKARAIKASNARKNRTKTERTKTERTKTERTNLERTKTEQ